ncbi:MAG: hypothetical protein JSU94_09215 [Phycisphaerales bacterium]|nr:MAG: hypothetical protein JSU94_09215 [Phycisphaerales bacterium]
MTGRATALGKGGGRAAPVVRFVGFFLPVLAVLLACGMSFFWKTPVPIEKPGILVFGALFVLVPFRRPALNTLQRLAAFYLIAVPVNELASHYFRLPSAYGGINISYSAVVLALCAIGFVFGRGGSANSSRLAERADISRAWVLALGVIIAHMLFLTPLLKSFYGYGYERDWNVLGSLCLYFLLFLTLWRRLGARPFRQVTALILTAFYVALTLAQSGNGAPGQG